MKPKSLKKHMIINLFAIPIAILLIVATIIIIYTQDKVGTMIVQKTDDTLNLLELDLQHYIEHPIEEMNIIKDLMKEEKMPFEDSSEMYMDYFKYNNRFDLVDENGIVIQSIPYEETRVGFDLSGSNLYLNGKNSQEDFVMGEIIYDPVDDVTSYYITCKVQGGYLIGYLNLDIFEKVLSEVKITDGYLGIVDERGVYVSNTNNEFVDQRIVDPYLMQISKGEVKNRDTIKYKDDKYLLQFIKVDEINWYILYYQNWDIVYQPIIQVIVIIAIAFTILIILLELIIIRTVKGVNDSVDNIISVTTMISEGSYELPDKNFVYKEIERLYSSMIVMSNKVYYREDKISSLNDELDESYYTMVVLLAKAIEAKDNYTGGHCERVRDFSMLLAKGLELTDEEKRQLKYGSTLHDIGKLGIPEYILNKESSFTDEEYELMKKHSSLGYDIISEMPSMTEAKQIILYHHERFDGKGYPYGLKGKDIPLLARIVTIADSFDAMTSERHYRDSYLTYEEACEELIICADKQFDRDLVDIFIEQIKYSSKISYNNQASDS